MSAIGTLVTLGPGRHPFTCHVCQGYLFIERENKINTTGAEFFGFGWANESATGLLCTRCGYLHSFMWATMEYWPAEGGYPPGASGDWGAPEMPSTGR